MPCTPAELRHVPLFSLLDDDELALLATQVEVRDFAAKQRIYKAGEASRCAYVVMEGAVRVTMIDQEGQEVLFNEPHHGEIFGFASMLEDTTHQTTAVTLDRATLLEVDRNDIQALLSGKPAAGLDMMTVLAREIHTAQTLVRHRTQTSPNEIIDEKETFGEHIADKVASFGGSWTFIISFGITLTLYIAANAILLATRGKTWDPYPFILLNLFLSMLAAIQAPVIMMSQNRQDQRDRTRSELDFQVNRRAEAEIQELSRRLNALDEKVTDVTEYMRPPNTAREYGELEG